MGRGAFAIGASDMDAGEPKMRLSEVFAKRKRIGQVFFEGRRADALEHRQLGEKIIECLVVGADGRDV